MKSFLLHLKWKNNRLLALSCAILFSFFLNQNISAKTTANLGTTTCLNDNENPQKESIRTGEIQELTTESSSNSRYLAKGVLKFQPTNTNQVAVDVSIFNPEAINPYSFSYDYNLSFDETNWHADVAAIMDPMDFYLEENLLMQYEGETIDYPYEATTATKLNTVEGIYTISSEATDWEMTYAVKSFDRTVIGTKTIILEGQEHEVTIISSKLSVAKTFNAMTTREKTEELIEWVSPDLGIINVERNVKETQGRQFQKQNTITQFSVK